MCGYALMLRITMNGATMNDVVTSAGVQRSLLSLHLPLTPRASGLTFSGVLNNSSYAAPFERVSALVQLDGLRARRWVRGARAQHQRARVHVELVMLTLALCAGPKTGGTVLTIDGPPHISHRHTPFTHGAAPSQGARCH